jgi:hypothetical protein
MTTMTAMTTIQEIVEKRKPVPNVSRIIPGLYIGDAESAKNDGGFTAIVNCVPGSIHIAYDNSIKYIECDVCYDGILPLRVESFIERVIDIGGRVLVHCVKGENLSAVVAIAYYMNHYDVDVVTAVKHCFGCRPNILTYEFFIMKLIEFDEERKVKALMNKVDELEDELIMTKRQIAVMTLNCDYEHLTLADLEEMKKNGAKLVYGLTSDEKSKKYGRICEKYREKSMVV